MSGLAVAIVVGIGFGAALESAGLGSARKLSAQFYGADWTVVKVMLSAIVVAMLGAFWLARAGWLDARDVWVPGTWIGPQLVGGVVFGAGMVTAGLCPGTACVAAASGRGDGLAVLGGVLAGVWASGLALASPSVASLYAAGDHGALTLPAWLGVGEGAVVAAVVAIALLAFAILEARS
jgi:uncharacterized membrane protein YedE/YeeE